MAPSCAIPPGVPVAHDQGGYPLTIWFGMFIAYYTGIGGVFAALIVTCKYGAIVGLTTLQSASCHRIIQKETTTLMTSS